MLRRETVTEDELAAVATPGNYLTSELCNLRLRNISKPQCENLTGTVFRGMSVQANVADDFCAIDSVITSICAMLMEGISEFRDEHEILL